MGYIYNPLSGHFDRVPDYTVDEAPVDTDEVLGLRAGSRIRTTWTIAKGFLKTYFDGLYVTPAQFSQNAAVATHDAVSKSPPVDADESGWWDSITGDWVKVSLANLKTTLLTTWKDATDGLVGMTLFKINFRNAANTFTSFLANANTAARTYTFQDRDGTIADNTDLAVVETVLTLQNGFENITGFSVRCRKQLKVVHVSTVLGSTGTRTVNTLLFTLPTNCCPVQTQRVPVLMTSDYVNFVTAMLTIPTSGACVLTAAWPAAAQTVINFTFIAA